MTPVRLGQVWTSNSAYRYGDREWFEVTGVDEERGVVSVRFILKSAGKRGGTKSLKNMRLGLGGARLEREADGTEPFRVPKRSVRGPTVAERSTASDHRKVQPPRGMTAEEREKWLASGSLGRDDYE